MVIVGEFVGGALLGAVVGELLNAVIDATKKNNSFKSNLNDIESILRSIIPIIEKIEDHNKVLDRPKEETAKLMEIIDEGKKIVSKCSKVHWWQCHKKIYYTNKLVELEKKLKDFFQINMQAQEARDIKETLLEVKDLGMHIRRRSRNENIGGGGYEPVDVPYTVGLNVPLMGLKIELFKDGSSVIMLTAPGGCGKTTLAKMLCSDQEVRGKFKDNIFFVTVSKTPDLKVIVRKLFHKCHQVPEFTNDEDAINQLEQLLRQIGPNPILLVLDDVWSGSESLIEKFKFQLSDYKILVTSRFVFPRFGSPHRLETLNDEDARTLFGYFAFPQDGSSDITDEKLVKKIVKGCKGFPLALKVVGSSLCGQPPAIWQSKVMEWAEGVSILESNFELHDCLKNSLDGLDSKVKECYMDLGSFPEDQRIPATALIDMWVELYNLDEDGVRAIASLHELSYRNLLNLVVTRKDAGEVDGFYNEHFVMQHDILRELVIYQNRSSSEQIQLGKRLFIDISGNKFPDWWLEPKPLHISARLLSISTDETFSSSWCDMQAPEAEVLVLNFRTKKYTVPDFLEKMDKLKVLVVTNYGFFPTELGNFALLGSLSNLKRLRLEHVSIPSLRMTTLQLRKLKKISLVMCTIGQAFSNYTIKFSDALPNLVEIDIDYCNDLVELPDGLCDVLPLKKLSISNCHKFSALPNDIRKLVNLEVLRLSSCTDLSELPDTIGSLSKLSFLDISDCLNIRKLPSQFGELHSLRKLCMRGCSSCDLPPSIMNLEHLEEVRCDEDTSLLWEPFQLVLGNIRIVVLKEDINLNWLHNPHF